MMLGIGSRYDDCGCGCGWELAAAGEDDPGEAIAGVSVGSVVGSATTSRPRASEGR